MMCDTSEVLCSSYWHCEIRHGSMREKTSGRSTDSRCPRRREKMGKMEQSMMCKYPLLIFVILHFLDLIYEWCTVHPIINNSTTGTLLLSMKLNGKLYRHEKSWIWTNILKKNELLCHPSNSFALKILS